MKSIIKKASFVLGILMFSNVLFAEDLGIYMPYGVTKASDGTIYAADTYGNRILKFQGETPSVIAGVFSFEGSYVDGAPSSSQFNQPLDVAVNSKGELFVADSENNSIRKIANSKVTTLSGNGTAGYQDGTREKSQFNLPSGLAFDNQDNLYIADTLNHVIRKISFDGKVSTVAGSAGQSSYKDGSSSAARFNEPTDVVVTKDGVLYVADSGNQCIRKIVGSQVTTVCGLSKENTADPTYRIGGYADGKSAQFSYPKSLTLLDNGDILVADMMNNAVRKIKTNGEVVTVLNSDNSLDAPVGLLYKDNALYVSQKWKAGLQKIAPEADRVVSGTISHAKWLEITPYSAPKDSIQVWSQGNEISSSASSPQLINNKVYLPLRTAVSVLGGQLKWDAKLKQSKLIVGNKTIIISQKNTKVINGNALAEIKYLETLLPAKIDWVEQYKAIVISPVQ